MVSFVLEVGVGHTQVAEAAELKESLSILVQFRDAVVARYSWPGLPVSTHPSVEVSEKVDMLRCWNPADGGIKLIVKLVLDFGCSKQGWCEDAHEIGKGCRRGEVQGEDSPRVVS